MKEIKQLMPWLRRLKKRVNLYKFYFFPPTWLIMYLYEPFLTLIYYDIIITRKIT